MRVNGSSKPSHNFGSLPSMPRSADRFLLQLVPQKHLGETRLTESQGVLGHMQLCVMLETVMTGVWLFSGVVCTWERVIQQCLDLVSKP